jgi:hypothetical protein
LNKTIAWVNFFSRRYWGANIVAWGDYSHANSANTADTGSHDWDLLKKSVNIFQHLNGCVSDELIIIARKCSQPRRGINTEAGCVIVATHPAFLVFLW